MYILWEEKDKSNQIVFFLPQYIYIYIYIDIYIYRYIYIDILYDPIVKSSVTLSQKINRNSINVE